MLRSQWFAAELRDHAVLYVNSDTNERGFFSAEGAHSVEHFINDITRQAPDPETSLTVWEAGPAASATFR